MSSRSQGDEGGSSDWEEDDTPVRQSRPASKPKGRQRRGGKGTKRQQQQPSPNGAMDSVDSSFPASPTVAPPAYPMIPYQHVAHGDSREDPHYWLHDRANPAVKKLLKQENAYVEHFFTQPLAALPLSSSSSRVPTAAGAEEAGQRATPPCPGSSSTSLRRTLFNEMRGRWKEDDSSLPSRDRSYWYYVRHVTNAEYPIFCRRPYRAADPAHDVPGVNAHFLEEVVALWRDDPAASLPFYDDEVVYLDVNLLVQDLRLQFVEIGDFDISPDEQQIAVTLDCSNGKEIYTVFVLDIVNVDFRAWLAEGGGASDLQRAWTSEAMAAGQSMYTPGSPTERSRGPAGGGGSSTHSSPTSTNSARYGSPTMQPERRRQGGGAGLRAGTPRPQHRMRHRLELFDMADEVLWLGPSALLYLGLDDKMRPYQVVYHDLRWPDDDPDGSVVCYEEGDEAFFVGALSFTADDAFVAFQSASSDSSEWYLIPAIPLGTTSAPLRRDVKGVPAFLPDADMAAEFHRFPLVAQHGVATTARFAARADGHEYDVDHHPQLLGPGEGDGAWLVTSNARGCLNFAVYVLPDAELVSTGAWTRAAAASEVCGWGEDGNADAVRGGDATWRPLLQYDPLVQVEDITCTRHYLLFSVRRGGCPAVLLCPVTRVWRWWREGREVPLPLDALVDLSVLFGGAELLEGRWLEDWVPASAIKRRSSSAPLTINGGGGGSGDGDAACTGKATPLPLHVECYTCSSGFDAMEWRVAISALLHPSVALQCRLALPREVEMTTVDDTSVPLMVRHLRREVVHGPVPYDPSAYDGEVVWVPSSYAFATPLPASEGGTEVWLQPLPTREPAADVLVPVTLCWRRDLYHQGENALMLHVYGAYGDTTDPSFSAERLALLDRGVVWGYAAVRGGGELGIPWRDAGRKLQRATAINDFVSCARYVQDTRRCAPGRLISAGGSAGGLVVGRALTLAPTLFHSVIGNVPFVDCLTSLMDISLPLTITEWDEFGNPTNDPEAYALLKAMSPIDALPLTDSQSGGGGGQEQQQQQQQQQGHTHAPHVLLVTAWGDSRVGYWESMKLAARLRLLHPSSIVLHHCDLSAGHGGASGRYEQLKDIAREYAFALRILALQ